MANKLNKYVLKYEVIGFFIVTLLGVFFHFAYEFSGMNSIVGLFTATNESTFEHMKLLLYPFLIYTIFEYIALIRISNSSFLSTFVCAKTIALIWGLYLIPTLFYTYSGALGRNISWIDISIFVISVLASFIASYFISTKNTRCRHICAGTCILILCFIIFFFISFTINPPQIEFFKSPV